MESQGLTKNDQRALARERARLMREAEKKRVRRRRVLLQAGIGVAILAIAAVIVSVAVANPASSLPGTAPKNMAHGGIVLQGADGEVHPVLTAAKLSNGSPSPAGTLHTSSVPHVVTYIDWACPVCRDFEAVNARKLQSIVSAGKATLEIHPVAILDRNYAGSRYSSRAANAAACVANFVPTKFLAAQSEFYNHQPEEGSTGLTNGQIIQLLTRAGAGTASVQSCVNHESFKNWVAATTQRTASDVALVDPESGGFGTPTVFVNGHRWDETGDLVSFINAHKTK